MRKFKGQLEGFPEEVVEIMLDYQVEQGNKRNVEVFEKISAAGKESEGFDWSDTEEEEEFWDQVIIHNNFDLFFSVYPKIEGYLFKNERYRKSAEVLLGYEGTSYPGLPKFHFIIGSTYYHKLSKHGVLDIFCKPVLKQYKPELPRIDGYNGKFKNGIISYGCAELPLETLKEIHKRGFTLEYQGTEICATEIKKILETIDKNKNN